MSTQAAALRALSRRTDPADAGAQNNLGVVLLARGRREDAAAAFARALELDPQMRLARENLAVAADASWRVRRARELRARLRADGADAEARRELARLHTAFGEFDEARRELAALLALRPSDVAGLVLRALCERAAGDLDAAALWLGRARAVDPKSAVVLTHLGEVHYHRGEPHAALTSLDAALALAPEHAEAHHARAFVLGELGRHGEAAEAARRGRDLNPALGRHDANLPASQAAREVAPAVPPVAPPPPADDVGGHLALGVAFRQKGYFDEAAREYRRAVARGADERVALRALGELHLLRGAPAEAEPPLRRLCALDAADAAAWNALGVATHLAGDVTAALAAYSRAAEVAAPGDIARGRAHNNMAVVSAAAGELAAARAGFARAVAESPDLRVARLNLAQTLAVAGDGEAALAAYRELLRDAPNDAEVWTGVGSLLAEAGRHADARTAFARAVDADPSRTDARYHMAFEAAALGDHDEARRDVERALALTPYVSTRPLALAIDLGHPIPLGVDAWAGGDARVRGFELPAAAVDTLLAGALSPAAPLSASPEPGSPFAVAEECLRAGLYDRATAAVSRALARGADRATALAILGDTFARQGFFGEALERYAEARQLAPADARATVGEARMLREVGRRGEAAEAAEAARARWPDSAACWALAAAARVDRPDGPAVEEALERAEALDGDARVWGTIAEVWRALGVPGRCAEACRRALAADPLAPALRLALGRALAADGDADGARATFGALTADAPAYAEGWLELAALAQTAGDSPSAVAALVEVLTRDPYHLDALATLGDVLADAGRSADAEVAVTRVLRLDAEHARALAVSAALCAARGERRIARERWRRVIELEPAGAPARRARQCLTALTAPDSAPPAGGGE